MDSPIKRCRKQTIRHHCLLIIAEVVELHLVRLLPVTSEVCQLQVVYIRGVASFVDRYDVIYRRAEGVGVFQTEVHRLPADPADRLRCIDPLLILFKLCPVFSIFFRSVTCCHNITNEKDRASAWSRLERKASNENPRPVAESNCCNPFGS